MNFNAGSTMNIAASTILSLLPRPQHRALWFTYRETSQHPASASRSWEKQNFQFVCAWSSYDSEAGVDFLSRELYRWALLVLPQVPLHAVAVCSVGFTYSVKASDQPLVGVQTHSVNRNRTMASRQLDKSAELVRTTGIRHAAATLHI